MNLKRGKKILYGNTLQALRFHRIDDYKHRSSTSNALTWLFYRKGIRERREKENLI